jgi:acyl-CoA reductase-like NAD-dependent aldehyde dehydrogenase
MPQQPARHWIDGDWVAQGNVRATTDVFTGKDHRRYCCGGADIAQRAIESARRAFEHTAWAHQPRQRAAALSQLADAIERRAGEISQTIAIENGKVLAHCIAETRAAISECRYYSGLARAIFGRVAEIDEGKQSVFSREAVGVASIIVPWNAPSTLLIRALAPALAAGCTIVVKGAHQTAWVTHLYAQCVSECAAIPDGVVNFVHGELEVSTTLCAHPEVDVISFTGSSATGKKIMASAAATLKRLSLELGGKSPAIVFADADMDTSVREVARAIIPHCGQMCTAVSRILVEQSAWDRFVPALVRALQSVQSGDPRQDGVQMGPLIDTHSADRFEADTSEAADAGETVLAATRPAGFPRANFVTPALYRLQDSQNRLVQRELFAPVALLEVFEGEQQAVHSANATRYGLAASVYTNDVARSKRVARALKSGTVWINCHNRLFAEAETGGFKESGLGRLHGLEGLSDFLETKHVYSEFGRVDVGP